MPGMSVSLQAATSSGGSMFVLFGGLTWKTEVEMPGSLIGSMIQ